MSKALIAGQMEYQVEKFREENGLGLFAPVDFKNLLLKRNIITVFKPLSDDFSGLSIRTDQGDCFMLVNSNQILSRQHFTIAHEFYHLLVQKSFTTHKCKPGEFKPKYPEEYKADLFAACLILPKSGVMDMIPEKEKQKKNNISRETIFRLHQYFGASVKSVIMRLKDFGLVDKSYFDMYDSDLLKTARLLGYDDKLYKKANEDVVIGDYASLAMQLFEQEKISESHYVEICNAIGLNPYKK